MKKFLSIVIGIMLITILFMGLLWNSARNQTAKKTEELANQSEFIKTLELELTNSRDIQKLNTAMLARGFQDCPNGRAVLIDDSLVRSKTYAVIKYICVGGNGMPRTVVFRHTLADFEFVGSSTSNNPYLIPKTVYEEDPGAFERNGYVTE